MNIKFATLLFAELSFLIGMGSAIDMGAQMIQYNESPDGETADYIAMSSDLYAVAEDFNGVLKSNG